MNKLEQARFRRCVEQLRNGSGTDSGDSSDGAAGDGPAAGKRVTFARAARPVGATSAAQWDQSKEIGGGSLKLGAHGWWRIDGEDEHLASVDHAGRGWIDGRPATFALDHEEEEFEKLLKSLQRCECCPSASNCLAGGGLGWIVTSLLMLAYVHMQSSICPRSAGLSVRLSVCLPACLPACPSVCLSVCPSACLCLCFLLGLHRLRSGSADASPPGIASVGTIAWHQGW